MRSEEAGYGRVTIFHATCLWIIGLTQLPFSHTRIRENRNKYADSASKYVDDIVCMNANVQFSGMHVH